MASQTSSTYFLSLLRNSKKELNSEKFYDSINSEFSDLSKYHDKCKNIIVSNHKDKMIGICKMCLRYLESCKALNNATFSYEVPILFNYWLYDKLINIYGSDNSNEISIPFSSLQLI
ncbi:PIR Superfamily Protein [Plasmodium ovale wallikeri]|uniref:PIR Superfamily Protein n=1 Tax=Plasmodium ovale wallikeri TaxID=864142 RepID=A0A1A9APP7_PLAOA|nr:PIR Superfamily Protein [Plasmodium ovale wallikeri]SBT58190.1 PIR Superfamily Protein [Plasmodium ovale wallikeri]